MQVWRRAIQVYKISIRYNFSVIANVAYTLSVDVTAGQSLVQPLVFTLQIYDAAGSLINGSQTGSSITFPFFAAATGTYRIYLAAQNFPNQTPPDQTYQVNLCSSPTNLTATPQPGATATPTLTPFGVGPDAFENNDTPALVLQRPGGIASYINIGSQIANANFYPNDVANRPVTATGPDGDVDWYFFYARRFSGFTGSDGRTGTGGTYRIATVVQPGVDTYMALYRDVNCSQVSGVLEGAVGGAVPRAFGSNDDVSVLNRGSQIDFNSDEDCVYWVHVLNKDPAPRGAGQTYNISIVEFLATPGPTTSPVPSTVPSPYPQGIDSFEYNGDFDHATLIAAGVKYSNLNFVPYQPPSPDTIDNDFFRMPVKQGIYYTCDTLDLAPGVDTNMIVFNQDRAGIAGNDDISEEDRMAGRFNSRVTWLAGYTGIAYIVLGEVAPPRPNEAAARTYALQCVIGLPATPTPIGGIPTPTATGTPYISPTPEPPDPTMTPFPTPRTAQNLPVRKVDTLPGNVQPPTLAPTATPRPITLDVQVFNDNNQNGGLDPGEGISGASVRIIDESSATPLGQTTTDADGRARFTIFNDGPVRVLVPLFGYSTLITGTEATVRIALMPTEKLPVRMP